MSGVQSVIIPGGKLKPLWCVDNWVTPLKVKSNYHVFTHNNMTRVYWTLIDAVAFLNAHFGRGASPIYLDGVDCSGSENNILNCSHSSSVSCSISHNEDAGVRCQGM